MYNDQETSEDVQNTSAISNLSDSLSKLRDALFLHLGLNNLPEFSGSPKENIEIFLRTFERATATIPDEQRCLAVRRSLIGDADLYAKTYLEGDLKDGNWTRVKDELRKRFLQEDMAMLYRLELSKMKYDPAQTSLLSYIDRYANVYRKIHPKANNREIIEDLSIHLDKSIIRCLNQLSEDWKQQEDFESFRKLIRRLEKDILSLEPPKKGSTQEILSVVNQYVSAALEKPIKEMKELLESNKKETSEPEDHLAALRNVAYPDNTIRHDRNDRKRKDRPWEDQSRESRYRRPQQESGPFRNHRVPYWVTQLRKTYEETHGEVIVPCIICNGGHHKKHCPLQTDNLKVLGNLR